jgi:hypothetical protein
VGAQGVRTAERRRCAMVKRRAGRQRQNMIKHIVMWQIAGASPEEKMDAIKVVKSAFESLNGKIPGMRMLEIGIDMSRVDYAFDVVLYSEFESDDALKRYADHPEHLRVKQQIGNVRIARHQVDYQTSP